jgi:hypothetical protein
MSQLRVLLSAVAIASLSFSASVASAELYRYVDGDGQMYFVDDFNLVPERYRDEALGDSGDRDETGGLVKAGQTPTAWESPSAQSSAPAAAAPTPESGSRTKGQHDETWWRLQAEKKKQKLSSLQKQLADLTEEEESESLIYSSPGRRGHAAGGRDRGRGRPSTGALLAASDDRDYVTVEELEAAVQTADSDLEHLHERARRAGVPPGWLR